MEIRQKEDKAEFLEAYEGANPRLSPHIKVVLMMDDKGRIDLQAAGMPAKQLVRAIGAFLVDFQWESIRAEALGLLQQEIVKQIEAAQKGIQLAGMPLPPGFDPKSIPRG